MGGAGAIRSSAETSGFELATFLEAVFILVSLEPADHFIIVLISDFPSPGKWRGVNSYCTR